MSDESDDRPVSPEEQAERLARVERLKASMVQVHDLILAHATATVRELVRKEFSDTGLLADEIDKMELMLRDELAEEGGSQADIESAVAELRERLQALADGAPEHIDDVCEMACADLAPLLAGSWINVLGEFANRKNGIAWLRLAALGDDMLPRGHEADVSFNANFADTPFEPQAVRGILRAIRASLPAGKKLPDCMVEALEAAWRINVVP